jgi:Tat protein secretion system quality control protein TatD with DNase activity
VARKYILTNLMYKYQDKYEPDIKGHSDFLVRTRNEPCQLIHIIEIIAGLKQCPVEEIIKATYENTVKVFKIGEEIQK